jgi:hypothetical protein
MSKTMIFDAQLTRKLKKMANTKDKKVTSHGAFRAKRKPNSPIVLRAERAKAAAVFGKDPGFKFEIYGIESE